MAEPTFDPAAIAQARAAGYSDTEIADHLERAMPGIKEARGHGYSDKDIIGHLAGNKVADSPKEASGIVAGFEHGVTEAYRGAQETNKQLGLGEGPGAAPDPDFVPAHVINGANPFNWNWSQVPQKIAETAPGLAPSIAGAATGARIGASLGPWGAVGGGIIGGAIPAFWQTGGNAVKENAVRRTGDANAEPNTEDKVRGLGTSAVSSLIQGALGARLAPGAGSAVRTGLEGVIDAGKKVAGDVATGAVTGAAGNVVDQVGNKLGTEKGLQFDPAQVGDAAIGGAATAGTMGAARALADAHRAVATREFGGDNLDATKAYVARLVQAAGDKKLGSMFGAKDDANAHNNAVSGIQDELQAAARDLRSKNPSLNQDANNALQLATENKPLTGNHVDLIEQHADPATAFLARQMRVAQLAKEFGSFDNANGGWSGGLSGVADKWAMRPLKAHLLIGGSAAALGAHAMGSYSLPFLGSALGAYGVARTIDNLTGARSPAAQFQKQFYDANAQTRLNTQPQPQQAPAPGPWGARPLPTTSVPQVAQPAPAAPAPTPAQALAAKLIPSAAMAAIQSQQNAKPVAPAPAAPPAPPPISPMAVAMLQKHLKANPWAQEPAVAPEPAPEPTPQQRAQELAQKLIPSADMANIMAQQNAKPPAPNIDPSQVLAAKLLPTADAAKAQATANALEKERAKAAKEQETADEPAPAPSTPAAPKNGKITSIGQILAGLNGNAAAPAAPAAPALAQPAPASKISKSDGKIEVTPALEGLNGGPFDNRAAYRPIPEKDLTYRGKSHDEIADLETQEWLKDQQAQGREIGDKGQANYRNRVLDALDQKQSIRDALVGEFPDDEHMVHSLIDQLNQRGGGISGRETAKDAIAHYAAKMSPEGGKATKSKFDENAMRRIYETSSEKKARVAQEKKANGGTQTKGRKSRKAKGNSKVQILAAE